MNAMLAVDATSVGVGGGAAVVIFGAVAVLRGSLESVRDFYKERREGRDSEDRNRVSYVSVTSDQFVALNERLEEENLRLTKRVSELEAKYTDAVRRLDDATMTMGRQSAKIARQEQVIGTLQTRLERLEKHE